MGVGRYISWGVKPGHHMGWHYKSTLCNPQFHTINPHSILRTINVHYVIYTIYILVQNYAQSRTCTILFLTENLSILLHIYSLSQSFPVGEISSDQYRTYKVKSNSILRQIVRLTANNNRLMFTCDGTKHAFTCRDSSEILWSFEIFAVTL